MKKYYIAGIAIAIGAVTIMFGVRYVTAQTSTTDVASTTVRNASLLRAVTITSRGRTTLDGTVSATPVSSTPAVSSTPSITAPTATTTTPSSTSVSIAGLAFNPASMTVAPGTTVTWTNNDSVTHTVTADDGSFNSGNLAPGQTFTHTFSSAATIPYHCSFHTFMHGTITVSSAATTMNPTTTPATTTSSAVAQLMVNSWGGDWMVNLSSTTTVLRATGSSNIADLKEMEVGDRVQVVGQATTTSPTIDATRIRDRSIQFRSITGTVSNVSSDSFTLTTSGGIVLTVEMPFSGTVSVSGQGITSFSEITDGMRVRATGDLNLTSGNLYATIIVVRSVPSGVTVPTTTPTAPVTTTPAPTTPTPTTPTTSTSTPTAPTSASVSIAGLAFSPSTMTVRSGTTVTWTNNDSVTHTVTADDGSFNSGNLFPGQTFTHTFSSAGTVPYHCSIHTLMHGSIVVQ